MLVLIATIAGFSISLVLAVIYRQLISKRLDQGESSKNCFRAILGDPRTVSAAVLKWLRTEQEPFKPDFNEGEGIAPGVFKGWSSVTTTCHARADATEIKALLAVPEGAYICLLYTSPSPRD